MNGKPRPTPQPGLTRRWSRGQIAFELQRLLLRLDEWLARVGHPLRVKFIPSGSMAEARYYAFRKALSRAAHFLVSDLPRLLNPVAARYRLDLPAWWSKNRPPDSLYQALEEFWTRHAAAGSFTILISGAEVRPGEAGIPTQAAALRRQGGAVVFVYQRGMSRKASRMLENTLEGIFYLPLDALWQHPDRVFFSRAASAHPRRRVLIEYPHPALFRIAPIAQTAGWLTVYQASDNWVRLRSQGLADWYNPLLEEYLTSKVDWVIGYIDYSASAKKKTDTEDQTSKELAPDITPVWWSRRHADERLLARLQSFLEAAPAGSGAVLILSGVTFLKSEGQRSTWLARAFAHLGIPVIYAYFRFYDNAPPPPDDPDYPGVFQIPLDQVWAYPERILSMLPAAAGARLLLAEFPHPALLRLLPLFQIHGWKCVYEAIDDWAEFRRVGQAEWYDPAIEELVVRRAGALTATSPALKEAVERIGARNVFLLPNAFEPGSLPRSATPKPLPRGRLTVGYFGHLTASWFDWKLVTLTAARHPDWVFHILGYGYDAKWTLPANILLPGKVAHEDLPHYAANWDVAIIPFKRTQLSAGVNPIKVYEYLELRLPVVACGMPHLAEMPSVVNAQTPEEFEAMIEKAALRRPDEETVQAFLQHHTWAARARALLDLPQETDWL